MHETASLKVTNQLMRANELRDSDGWSRSRRHCAWVGFLLSMVCCLQFIENGGCGAEVGCLLLTLLTYFDLVPLALTHTHLVQKITQLLLASFPKSAAMSGILAKLATACRTEV